PPTDIHTLSLHDALPIWQGTNQLNLVRQDDNWTIRERYGYPANFREISDFLRKLWDLKVVQTEQIGPSQFARLELTEPGRADLLDRKSTRLNSSHRTISY